MTPEQMRALADEQEQQFMHFDTYLEDRSRRTATALRTAADTIGLLMQQRDALAEVAGIEPEWTEKDA